MIGSKRTYKKTIYHSGWRGWIVCGKCHDEWWGVWRGKCRTCHEITAKRRLRASADH